MSNFDKYDEMIPEYISGNISTEDRKAFESELKENAELRENLNKSKHIYMGLKVLEGVAKDHIDSQTLAEYSVNPDDFQTSDKEEIVEHLGSCKQCRDELLMCQSVKAPVVKSENTLKRIFNWFMTPKLILRPAIGMAIMLLIIGPLTYLTVPFLGVKGDLSSYKISSMGSRGDLKTENIISIKPDDKITRLEFYLEYIDGCTYNFELLDENNQTLFAKYSNLPSEPFIFDLPVLGLNPGKYTLVVKEFENGIETNHQFIYPLELVISK